MQINKFLLVSLLILGFSIKTQCRSRTIKWINNQTDRTWIYERPGYILKLEPHTAKTVDLNIDFESYGKYFKSDQGERLIFHYGKSNKGGCNRWGFSVEIGYPGVGLVCKKLKGHNFDITEPKPRVIEIK